MATFDTILRNGTIIDGTGFPRFEADVAIKDGRIAEVGQIRSNDAERILDAEGRIVAPGFVDTHTHYDAQIFWDPTCSNAGENGITTVVMGNCGFGFAPCKPEDRARCAEMMQTTEQIPVAQLKSALPWTWETFPEFLGTLGALPKAVNAMMFLPLNPLMVYVMGLEGAKSRRPTDAEIETMQRLLSEGLDAGACGLSVSSMGTVNNHVDFDGTPMPTDVMHHDDLCRIAEVFSRRGDGVIEIISQIGPVGDRTISEKLARTARRPILHNVFSTSDYTPDLHRRSMQWLTEKAAAGLPMFAATVVSRSWVEVDLWNSAGTSLDALEAHRELTMAATAEAKTALLQNAEYRERFRSTYDPVMFEATGGGIERYVLVSMGPDAPEHPDLGKTLGGIAEARGTGVVDTYIDLALESKLAFTLKTPPIASEDPRKVAELISHPRVLAGSSDGGAHTKIFSGGCWATDLLIWLARDQEILSFEEMHYRLSYQPARVLGLKDRGALLEGMAADVIVYDPKDLYFDRSRYETRHDTPNGDWRRYAKAGGYQWILVNGEITFERDVRRPALPGRMLRVTRDRNGSWVG